MTNEDSLTQRLRDFFGGDAESADSLLREIRPKLREIAARELHQEGKPVPLSATELIHELWVRNLSRASWSIRDRGHFYAIASLAMRRVLTDLARKRLTARRAGEIAMPERGGTRLSGTKDAQQIVEIGVLMDRLEQTLPDSARVVDMHYFAGFSFHEIAESNNLTVRQVRHRWKTGVKWLRRQMNGGVSGP